MWYYQEKEFIEENINGVGFVYMITNTINNKKYIGKKLFKKSKTKMIKGKRKRFKIDSDWKNYYGSNTELQNDVKLHGKEHFKREILKICFSKAECSYFELKYQMLHSVLEKEDFYNDWIYVRIRKDHLKNIH